MALSSTKAEYQAMAAAVQEAIYLRALIKEFGYPMKEPTYIGEDNQPCMNRMEIVQFVLPHSCRNVETIERISEVVQEEKEFS